MLQVFDTCRHFIRTLPSLVYDEKRVEDIDTDQEDHIYDECRYVLMENPFPREKTRRRSLRRRIRLDLAPKRDPYQFYRM